LLCDASKNTELLSLRLQLLVIGQPMKDFLLGFVADRARVVQDQVSRVDGLDLPIALLDERSYNFFRIVDVHLTAEGLQIKGLLRIALWNPRHIGKV